MTKSRLFKKVLFSAMFASASLFGPSSVFAQVKIGSNPTTISTTSSLEVEATNGKKVNVDKSTGVLTIQNTPSGSDLDSILTVNSVGDVHLINSQKLKRLLGTSGSAQMANSASQFLGNGVNVIDFTSVVFDDEGASDLTNNVMQFRRSGLYTVVGVFTAYVPNAGIEGSNNVGGGTIYIQKQAAGSTTWTDITSVGYTAIVGNSVRPNANTLEYFNVNDKVRFIAIPCLGCTVGNGGYSASKMQFTILKNL